MTDTYDVIIVGASFAGAYCASELAKKGYHVLLLDKYDRQSAEQVPDYQMLETDVFLRTGLERSGGDELIDYIGSYVMHSPHSHTSRQVEFSSLLVNGQLFLQRILTEALDSGAIFLQQEVNGLMIEDDHVRGIYTKDGETYYSQMVIDASGVHSKLRGELTEEWDLPPEILVKGESAIAYREVRQSHDMQENEVHLYFCMEQGYIWRTAYEVGVGSLHHEVNIKEKLSDFIKEKDWDLGEVLYSAGGILPIRAPLDNMLTHGFAMVGDSAFMVNTIAGMGIASALKGTRMLIDAVESALEVKDTSQAALWSYNSRYHKKYGAKLAYQDALRVSMLSHDLNALEFCFVNGLITSEDLQKSFSAELLHLPPWEKVKRGAKGVARPGLMLDLDRGLGVANSILEHFNSYPDNPAEFSSWKEQLNNLNSKMRKL